LKTATPFSEADLKAVAQVLESAAIHAELGPLFRDIGLEESADMGGLSKWKRILNVFAVSQTQNQTGNYTMKLIQMFLSPRRFVSRPSEFETLREGINQLLSFRGFELHPSGKFSAVTPASTIDEARARASRLRNELERRGVHCDVLAFCRPELMQENYFHAMLEATKSVSEKIRQKTGLSGDAGDLSTRAFSLGKSGSPALAFNSLKTDTDRSEQNGLMNLCVGMFGSFRNTTAHRAKITWSVEEQDALDLLTLVSFIHRRLDQAVKA